MKLLAGMLVLGSVAAVYWPATHSGFVWLDRVCFDDPAWVAYADDWKKLWLHNFYGWINYFRPFVIGLFVLEVKIFGVSAYPMHIVSLILHLLNTALVGLLSLRLLHRSLFVKRNALLCAVCMFLYGIHPALIEPVVWISCQFELCVTFFMLLGLLLNEKFAGTWVCAIAVAACFFFASCSKESAASFPFVLLLLDFSRLDEGGIRDKFRRMWQLRRRVYVALIVVGIAYLVLRHSWLGVLLQSTRNQSAFSTLWFQEICATYLTYWRVISWPMYRLGPIHELDPAQFTTFGIHSLAVDFAAMTILAGGFFLATRRSYLGFIVVAVTFSLLPVLHLVPIAFDESFYHERYAMFPIALVMALLPAAIYQHWKKPIERSLHFFGVGVALFWSVTAIANIRVTTPLWSDELTLWRWMEKEHPTSLIVKDHLLSTFIELGDLKNAEPLAEQLVSDNAPCPNCLLNAANLALTKKDIPRASLALEHLRDSNLIASQPAAVQGYVVATGRLLELQGRMSEAEEAYRGAIELDPLDPQARTQLALLLAKQHRATEAQDEADRALSLYSERDRPYKKQALEREISAMSSAPID